MKLYTYYRSQASFRVRIALNLKGIAREDSFLRRLYEVGSAQSRWVLKFGAIVPRKLGADGSLLTRRWRGESTANSSLT